MSHKKYIKRGNKVFGPYIYENYRVKGKTKTKYLGKGEDFSEKGADENNSAEKLRGNSGIYLRIFLVIGIIFLLGFAGYFFFSGVTGRATLDVASSYIYGENLSGNLLLKLKQGELIPMDSKLIIENGGYVQEFLLSDILTENANGSFFVEGVNLSGEGEGYGLAGKKLVYPEVNFVFKIVGRSESGITGNESVISNESSGGGAGEIPSEIPQAPAEETANKTTTPEETANKTTTETPAEIAETPAVETPTETETTETPTEEAVVEETSSEASGLTGAAVLENELEGKTSKDNPFRYNAGNNEDIEIISVDKGSVDDLVKSKLENEIIISTGYSEYEEGFGQEYLGDEKNVEINFDNLGILAVEGSLIVKLVYQDIVLAEASKEISVEGENLILNETAMNKTLVAENLTITNETVLNLSAQDITLKQYKAVINKPVKWLKKLNQDFENPIPFIEIPKEASNITIKTGDEIAISEKEAEDSEKVVDETSRNSLMTGNVVFETHKKRIFTRFWNWLGLGITGRVIEESSIENSTTETPDSKIIDISGIENNGEIAVEYETPGPISTEVNLTNGKRITISSGNYNYTDILAYSTIPNKIKIENNKSIRLYHYVWNGAVNLGEEVNQSINETEKIIEEINQTENVNVTVEINESEVSIEGNLSESNISVSGNGTSAIPETKKEEKAIQKEEKAEEKNKTEKEKNNQKGITGKVALDLGNVSIENDSEVNATLNESGVVAGYWGREETDFNAYDLDGDGNVDHIEWNVEHLSEQVYEIIYITKAEHLDENYTFIEDVYEQVKSPDGNYSLIDDGDYLRVTFEQNLTNKKDITIYARAGCNDSIVINGADVPCEIYYEKMRIDEIRRELNKDGVKNG